MHSRDDSNLVWWGIWYVAEFSFLHVVKIHSQPQLFILTAVERHLHCFVFRLVEAGLPRRFLYLLNMCVPFCRNGVDGSWMQLWQWHSQGISQSDRGSSHPTTNHERSSRSALWAALGVLSFHFHSSSRWAVDPHTDSACISSMTIAAHIFSYLRSIRTILLYSTIFVFGQIFLWAYSIDFWKFCYSAI